VNKAYPRKYCLYTLDYGAIISFRLLNLADWPGATLGLSAELQGSRLGLIITVR